MKTSVRERRLSLFGRANEGDKKAQAKILKDNLFDEWVDWNVQVRVRLDSIDWAERMGFHGPEFFAELEEYENIHAECVATNDPCAVIFREGIANSCMALLFPEAAES